MTDEKFEVRFYKGDELYDVDDFDTREDAVEAGESFLDYNPVSEGPAFELWAKVEVCKPTGEYQAEAVK